MSQKKSTKNQPRKSTTARRPPTEENARREADGEEAAARAVVALLGEPGLPAFLKESVGAMLFHAANRHGVDIMTSAAADAGYSVEALGLLFALTRGFRPDLAFEPVTTLAEKISAVIRHDELPDDMRSGFFEHIHGHNFDDTAPEFISLILDAAKRKEGGA